jgi:signal transduction histidine kinase
MDKDDGSRKLYSGMIREKIHDLDDLLKQITSIAFNNMKDVEIEAVRWKEVIPFIVAEFKTKLPEVKCHISINYKGEFYNDGERIRMILRCLISNAFKYVNKYTDASPKVEVVVSNAGNACEIEIVDNGVGISKEHLSEIFNLFYKANAEFKGNGIGLYIVKSVLDKIGGTINVSSKVGTGTTFKIRIPNRLISLHLDEA